MSGPFLDAWSVEEQEFTQARDLAAKLELFLKYAVLAPSGHNTQPWLFKLGGEHVELYADTARRLPVVDPYDRELIISCAGALFCLRIAMRHFGYTEHVQILPDPGNPDLLARVSVDRESVADEDDDLLFAAIIRRHTNRLDYEKRGVPDDLAKELGLAADRERAWLRFVPTSARGQIAALVERGDRLQGADRAFRQELASWIRSNGSPARDGMPGYAFGMGSLMSRLGPSFIRSTNWGKGQGKKDKDKILSAPLLAVLGTGGDSREDWMKAGQALARVLLRAQTEAVSASFFNQPVEVDDLRKELLTLIPGDGAPQLIFRLGYGKGVRPTPRRLSKELLEYS